MVFFAIFAAISLASLCLATPTTVTYDGIYDNANTSLDKVACSDGSNGLITKNFTTFGSLPTFPYIGGAFAVAGYNSPACGSCWVLTHTSTVSGNGTSVNGTEGNNGTSTNGTFSDTNNITVLAINHSSGFNIALEALNALTGGKAVQLGTIEADAVQVNASVCGL